ncbi:hypothetical protein QBC37DRAFT_375051 [Rhypophila decipiens]|uniref:Uncharacterized protein n=1 Tax=Rhypophila decipiens TaxID=261697 RepID=A0AAN7B724_9PEZI|nr:hypothetical protein QBC37DRAFT_375051 [Rhypophila decipiens]
MDTAIHTHPSNAAQAKAVTAPGSLSFPGASGELTPPSSVHEGAGSRTWPTCTPNPGQIVVAAAQLRAAPGDIPEDSDVVELDTTASRSESVESAIAYDYSAWDTWTSSATTSVNAISGSSDVSAPR